MGLRSALFTFLGDFRAVHNLCLPPCLIVGEIDRRVRLGIDYRAASRLVQPGDILVSRQRGYLSNLAIPGSFKHAAYYAGPLSGHRNPETGTLEHAKMLPSGVGIFQTLHPRSIIHSTSDGVIVTDLVEFLSREDYVAAFRPILPEGIDKNLVVQRIIVEACKRAGTPYNFDFSDAKDKSFYCTEFVVHLCKQAGMILPPKTMLRTKMFKKKNPVTLADSFAVVFPMIWCTVSCSEPSFVRYSAIPEVLRSRIYEAQDGEDLSEEKEKTDG